MDPAPGRSSVSVGSGVISSTCSLDTFGVRPFGEVYGTGRFLCTAEIVGWGHDCGRIRLAQSRQVALAPTGTNLGVVGASAAPTSLEEPAHPPDMVANSRVRLVCKIA